MNKYYNDESDPDFVSKTQQKNEALTLKKFGLELTDLTADKLVALPISEVTLKSLLDYKKITTHLARKRHLMFIGKCLRSEDEDKIKEYLESQLSAQLKTKAIKKDPNDEIILKLIEFGDSKIEELLSDNINLDRQTLRQILRNIRSAKNEQKKLQAVNKMKVYLNDCLTHP